MITILIVFACIELAIIILGLIPLLSWKGLEAVMGCAILAYGSAINAFAFVVTTVIFEHVHMHVTLK